MDNQHWLKESRLPMKSKSERIDGHLTLALVEFISSYK
jgi:hypothetical protein